MIWYLNVSHVTSKINSNSHHKKNDTDYDKQQQQQQWQWQRQRNSIASTWYYTSNEQNVKDDWLFYCYRQNSNIVNREKCHRVPFTMLICPFPSNSSLTQSYRTELPSTWMFPLPSPLSPFKPVPSRPIPCRSSPIALLLSLSMCFIFQGVCVCVRAAASKQLLIFMHSPHISFDNSIRRQIHGTPGTLYHPAHTRSAIWSG